MEEIEIYLDGLLGKTRVEGLFMGEWVRRRDIFFFGVSKGRCGCRYGVGIGRS